MQCPAGCDAHLVMAERQGVEIDYCPKCRGVWLDRGELDKIIERASEQLNAIAPVAPTAPLPPPPAPSPEWRDERYDPRYRDDRHRGEHHHDRDDDDHRRGYPPKKKKKRGFLEDMFDFD